MQSAVPRCDDIAAWIAQLPESIGKHPADGRLQGRKKLWTLIPKALSLQHTPDAFQQSQRQNDINHSVMPDIELLYQVATHRWHNH